MPVPESGRSPHHLRYGFAGVQLDWSRQSLRVDGVEVPAAPLMLRLLQVLCEADGRLLKRAEVFESLWPGGQEVSEAALSQLVWRLRGALGPYGELIATVRRSGLRLDAPVSRYTEPEPPLPGRAPPPAAPQAMGVPAPTRRAAASSRRRRIWGAASLLALLAVLLAVACRPRDAVIDAGYALRISDLQGSRSETTALAAAAFAAEDAGERGHAQALMRSLHAADPATPVPALMLAWWSADASRVEAERWLDAAHRRIGPDASPYLRLFSEYVTVRASGRAWRGPLDALLALRPQAFNLQFARAHDQLAHHELAGALRSLRQIPVPASDAERAASVLLDRVSLGDPAAVGEARAHPAIAADPVFSQLVAGRLAYSAGELDAAVAAFDRGRELAAERREYRRQREFAQLAALAATERDDALALPHVLAAARLCHEQDALGCEAVMLGFQAFLAARRGERDAADAALVSAWRTNPWDWNRPPLVLLALENGLAAPADPVAVARDVGGEAVFGGVAELILAWQAQAQGDMDGARRLLAQARERGIGDTYHAADAQLLAARLGGPAAPCRVDPPYPNELRLAACIALRSPVNRPNNQPPALQ